MLTGGQYSFQLRCDVQSSEIPSILWTFTNTFSQVTFQISNAAGSLDSRYSVTFPSQKSSILTINNVQLENHGVYTCFARTGQLNSQASSTLSILGMTTFTCLTILINYHINASVAPSVPVITGYTDYNESDVAVLECEVITYPSPTLTWIKRGTNIGTVIINSQRKRITSMYSQESPARPAAISRLILAGLSPSDNGTYSCQVNTDIPGYVTVSNQLTIYVQSKYC